MKAVVIGAGYVGKNFGFYFAEKGHQVVVTTRTQARLSELKKLGLNPCLLEARDEKAVEKVIKGMDVVIVAIASQGEPYEEAYFKTAQAIVTAVINTTSVMQVIYTSSTSVYGDAAGGWVTEKTPCFPLNSSTEWLKKTEEIYLSLNPLVCSTVLRLGEVYGPGREIEKRIVPGAVFPGDGSNLTNLIHLEDIVEALNFVIERKLSGIWNLCQDTHITRKELYQTLSKNLNLPEPKFDPAKKSLHSSNKKVSNTAIKKAGFVFKYS